MKLVTKIRFGIILGFIIVIIASALIANHFTLKSAEEIDLANAARIHTALENRINQSLQNLVLKDVDWGVWDDTYYYVQDGNQEYVESNLQIDTPVNLEINLIIIANISGDRLIVVAVDPQTSEQVELWPDVSEKFNKDSYFYSHPDEESRISGIIMTSKGPMMIASVPITPSLGGDIKGSIIFGKFITSEVVDQWSASLGYPINFGLPGDTASQYDNEPVRITNDKLYEYILINDVDSRPALNLEVEIPRDVYSAGKNTVRLVVGMILLFSLFFIIIFLMFFEKMVLARISRMMADVVQLTATPGTEDRIIVTGKDELSELAKSINTLLDSISRYNAQLKQDEQKLKQDVLELENTKSAILNIMEDLTESMEKQKRLERIKTEFLSVTSHELRTPITPIRAQLQMILAEYFGKVTPEQKNSLSLILDNTTRLDRLIGDILDISKLQSGVMKFVTAQADLSEIAKNAADTMRTKAEEHKLTLTLSAQKTPKMMLDRERMIQVFVNLINNAIKFTDAGGKIAVSVEAGKDKATVRVKDTGVGIAKSDIPRLFAPFEQVDSSYSRNHEGTGLGLAICRGIVIQHGGEIWIESEVGKGSTFIFTVPYKPKNTPGSADIELFHADEKYRTKNNEITITAELVGNDAKTKSTTTAKNKQTKKSKNK